MIFPDARQRVPTPSFPPETIDVLKRRAYKPASVELTVRPDLNFTFLRPPGWEVGPPVMSPSLELPIPALASFTRKNPSAGVELLVFESRYDCLPGDFLDSTFDAVSLSHRSEGPVGDGWYADRMGAREHGYELMAAHRKGKDLFVFLCAMPTSAVASCRDEVNAVIGTFVLKAPRPHPFAERWRVHRDDSVGLSFALPDGARPARALAGADVTWSIDGGEVELSVRPLSTRETATEEVEQVFKAELQEKGIVLGEGRVGDLPAAPGGVFAGEVAIRLFDSTPSSTRSVEALVIAGARKEGGSLRIAGVWPSRAAHTDAWMRGRFALVQLVATMK